jgi:hypothetical protein
MPGSFMTHLALADSSAEPGAPDVEWGELVSDVEYDTARTHVTTERTMS